MMININLQIHHIGYAVKDINKAIDEFTSLGYLILEKIDDLSRNITIVFANKSGYSIELISPLCSEKASPIDLILKKNGSTPYHICYEVDDIKRAIASLKQLKFIQISEISSAPAIDNKNVVFLYNSTIGVIELVERSY